MLKNAGIYILGIIAYLFLPWWAILVYFGLTILFTKNDLFIVILALLNDFTFAPNHHLLPIYFKNTIFVLVIILIKFLLIKFTRVSVFYDQKK